MTAASLERLVVRPPIVVRLQFPCLVVLVVAATVITRSIGGLAAIALLSWVAYREVLISTVADEQGLTIRGFLRTKRLAWSEVAGFGTKGSVLMAVTEWKTFVILEGVDLRRFRRAESDRRLAALSADLNTFRSDV